MFKDGHFEYLYYAFLFEFLWRALLQHILCCTGEWNLVTSELNIYFAKLFLYSFVEYYWSRSRETCD